MHCFPCLYNTQDANKYCYKCNAGPCRPPISIFKLRSLKSSLFHFLCTLIDLARALSYPRSTLTFCFVRRLLCFLFAVTKPTTYPPAPTLSSLFSLMGGTVGSLLGILIRLLRTMCSIVVGSSSSVLGVIDALSSGILVRVEFALRA